MQKENERESDARKKKIQIQKRQKKQLNPEGRSQKRVEG
tara:strand:+ start:594 stop:710 length:117 start_codon:yes stop_codon:yes gene_type:complete